MNKAQCLDSIDREIASGQYGLIDRMLIIRHGQIVFDRSYPHDYAKAYADSVNVKGALNAERSDGSVQLLQSVVASVLSRRRFCTRSNR